MLAVSYIKTRWFISLLKMPCSNLIKLNFPSLQRFIKTPPETVSFILLCTFLRYYVKTIFAVTINKLVALFHIVD